MQVAQPLNHSIYRLGFWSAVLVTAAVVVFAGALLAALPLSVSFAASFLLAPCFVALMASLHYAAPPDKRLWSHLGLVFAGMYAVLCTASYYIQLAVVSSNSLQVSEDALKLWVFTPGSAIFAQDMLGYAFMCLATLAAAPVFAGPGLERWLKGFFVAHGLLFAPTLVAAAMFPLLAPPGPASSGSVDVGAMVLVGWAAIFLPIPIMLAARFRRRR